MVAVHVNMFLTLVRLLPTSSSFLKREQTSAQNLGHNYVALLSLFIFPVAFCLYQVTLVVYYGSDIKFPFHVILS